MKFCCYFEKTRADNGSLLLKLHSNDNPQKHLDIPQFEDSLTTKKLMPFLTYSLVTFSTKQRGTMHINICTIKVHVCSVPRLDFFFVVFIKIGHYRFYFVNHPRFYFIMTFISNQKF